MVKAVVAFALLVFGLTGCASHKASMYSVGGHEVFIGWNNQQKLPGNAYYVLIEGDKEAENWTIKEVYNHPIYGRSNNLQEVLFVDREFRYVQPFFQLNESTVIKYGEDINGTLVGRTNSNGQIVATGMDVSRTAKYLDRGSWECGAVIQDNKDKYGPCTSRLTKTDIAKSVGKNLFAAVLTLGLASGTHQVIDKQKVADILVQTDLFERLKKNNIAAKAGEQQ